MFSEINPFDFCVITEFLRSAGSKNRSIIDDISAVSDLQGFSDIMIGNKDPDALAFQMVNNFLDLEHRDGVDAGKGFVEEDELRRDDQRAGNFYPASFTAR